MKGSLWSVNRLVVIVVCAAVFGSAQVGPALAAEKDKNWNIAFGMPVDASGFDKGFLPGFAVDGLYDPYLTPPPCWRMSSVNPNWIEVTFPKNAQVDRVSILVGLAVKEMTFEVLARLPDGKFDNLGTFNGKTDPNGIARYDIPKPRGGITAIRIDGLDPTSPCIFEIEIDGRIGSTEPIVLPSLDCIASPDIIYHNGTVITMNPAQPEAQAVAILNGYIHAVGSSANITSMASECTILTDLAGYTLLPGFIDSHQHRIFGLGSNGYDLLEPVIQLALQQGWTSVSELYVTEPQVEELRELDLAGTLRLRVNAYLAITGHEGEDLGDWYQAYHAGTEYSPYLRLAGVKIVLDHGWGSDPPMFTQEQVDQMVLEAHGLGWQIAVHTVSESAHTMVLNALETAQGGVAADHYRHRIEHVVVISDEDIDRMERLGVIASIQLNGPGTWMDDPTFPSEVPSELRPLFARWRDLFGAGVFVVGSSDWHSATPLIRDDYGSPMLLLYQAVTRVRTDGDPPAPWMLNQAITIEQALRSLTINGAYATFEEDKKGSLEAGKLADLIVISANPLEVPEDSIKDIQVLVTLVAGRAEYCRSGFESFCP